MMPGFAPLAALALALCATATEGQQLNFKVAVAEFEACQACFDGAQSCKWCAQWKQNPRDGSAGAPGACQCEQGNANDCHFALAFSDEVTDKAACRTFLPETQAAPSCTSCPEGCGLCRSANGQEFCDCTGLCDCTNSGGKCDPSPSSYFNLQLSCNDGGNDGGNDGDNGGGNGGGNGGSNGGNGGSNGGNGGGDIGSGNNGDNGGGLPGFVLPLIIGICAIGVLIVAYLRAVSGGTEPPSSIPMWEAPLAVEAQPPSVDFDSPAFVSISTTVIAVDAPDREDDLSSKS